MQPPASFDGASFKASLLPDAIRDFTRVYSVCFEPEGRFLAAATHSGAVHVWDCASHLTAGGIVSACESPPKPAYSFAAHDGPVYSMCFIPSPAGTPLLVTGGDTEIRVWQWSDIVSAIAGGSKPVHCAEMRNPTLSHSRAASQLSETNGLAWDGTADLLFSAGGDGNAYGWDITRCGSAASVAPVATFAGHSDYLHCIAPAPTLHAIATGSEDGTARLWDVRNSASGSVATFASVAVEGGESWVGGAAIDPADNWLAIGSGSGGVGVYHIGSRILTASGQASGAVQHMMFHEGQLLSCGGEAVVRSWSLKGQCKRTIPTLVPSCFSVAANKRPGAECLVIAGSSPLIDVCVSYGSRTFSLSC